VLLAAAIVRRQVSRDLWSNELNGVGDEDFACAKGMRVHVRAGRMSRRISAR